MRTNANRWRGFALLGTFLLTALNPACGADADDPGEEPELGRVFEQEQLDIRVEAGLDSTLPVVTPAQLELHRLRKERNQVAETMRVEVEAAMAPAVLVASLFAIEGVADVVLAITPVHRLERVGDMFKKGRELHGQKKHAKLLEGFASDVSELTGHSQEELIKLGRSLSKAQLRAMQKIRKHTDSAKVTHKLMVQEINGNASLAWIAGHLSDGHIDSDFVRRFSFDGDMVREYTTYAANPSWKTLEDIVSGTAPVASKTRDSLASKVTGLLGEQAAATMVRSRGFRYRFFRGEHIDISLARGVGYGGNRSIDIVASGRDHVVFAEVKNWSFVTWVDASKRRKVVEQLERHNEGVDYLMVGKALTGKPRKLLMVRKEGYEDISEKVRKDFEKKIQKLGWVIERIPGRYIPDFSDLLDALK